MLLEYNQSFNTVLYVVYDIQDYFLWSLVCIIWRLGTLFVVHVAVVLKIPKADWWPVLLLANAAIGIQSNKAHLCSDFVEW